MSDIGPAKTIPSTAHLSPEARAMLAEINGGPLPTVSSDDALDVGALAAPKETLRASGALGSGIVLSPHADAHAAAFADLLDHIEDSDGTMHVDERAALAAASKFKQQKQMPLSPGDIAGEHDDDASMDAKADFDADFDADFNADFDDDVDADFDGSAFDDADFDLDDDDEAGGFLSRFKKKSGGAVNRLIGFKDASSAYDAQSGGSLLPFTIMRAVVLVLVAAVPPLVNLIIIQPQISDNNRKLTQIRTFEAKAQEDGKKADDLAIKIARADKAAKTRIGSLMPETEAQDLINRYIEALQQFEVDLLSYNVGSKQARKVVAGKQVQEATTVKLEMISRYDIYVDIRKIFVEQANNIIVLSEVFETQPDSLKLKITAEFLLPTYRPYDSELDKPVAKKEEGSE